MEILPFFLVFAVTTLFTPGPNNIMLTASGANYGLKRTLPHLFGVDCGFAFMVFLVGMGFGAVFSALPELQAIMRWIGATFLVCLGVMIAISGRTKDGTTRGRPLTFIEAAAFQWVNPKAWSMAIGTFATFAPEGVSALTTAAVFAGIFFVIGLASSMTWAGFGIGIRRALKSDLHLRIFNVTLGLLTIASVALLFIEPGGGD